MNTVNRLNGYGKEKYTTRLWEKNKFNEKKLQIQKEYGKMKNQIQKQKKIIIHMIQK